MIKTQYFVINAFYVLTERLVLRAVRNFKYNVPF